MSLSSGIEAQLKYELRRLTGMSHAGTEITTGNSGAPGSALYETTRILCFVEAVAGSATVALSIAVQAADPIPHVQLQ